jgi:hypothetical protein
MVMDAGVLAGAVNTSAYTSIVRPYLIYVLRHDTPMLAVPDARIDLNVDEPGGSRKKSTCWNV